MLMSAVLSLHCVVYSILSKFHLSSLFTHSIHLQVLTIDNVILNDNVIGIRTVKSPVQKCGAIEYNICSFCFRFLLDSCH